MVKSHQPKGDEPDEINVVINGRRLYPKDEMIKARLSGVTDLEPITKRYHDVYFVDKALLKRLQEWVLANVGVAQHTILSKDLTPEQVVKRVLDDKGYDYKYLTGHSQLVINDTPIDDKMIHKIRNDALGIYRISNKKGELFPHPHINTKDKFDIGLSALCLDKSVSCNPLMDYFNSRSHAEATSFEASMTMLREWIHQPLNIRGGRSEVSELVSWRIIVSVIARQKYPGIIIRNHPVIIGGKGAGKTSMVRELLPLEFRKLYYQPSLNITDKNNIIYSVMGRAIVEVAEMGGIRRADANFLKAFLSEGQCSARLAYKQYATDVLYTHTIIGTANEETDPLPMDKVAAQRWVPLWVDRREEDKKTRSPVEDYMRANRDRLYAAGNMVINHLKSRDKVERFIMTISRDLEKLIDQQVEEARYNPDGFVEEEVWDFICRTIDNPQNIFDGLPHYTYVHLCENCQSLSNIRTDKRRASEVLRNIGLYPVRYNRSDVPPARMWALPRDRYLEATKHARIYRKDILSS